MKTIKMIGYAGIASAALALLVPTMSITESAQARTTNEESSASVVHRVSHTLAADTKYTASVSSSGYKWGQKIEPVKSDVVWTGAEKTQKVGISGAKSSAPVNLVYQLKLMLSKQEIRGVVETFLSKREIRGVVETSPSKREIRGAVETFPSKQEIRGVVETSLSKQEIRGVVETFPSKQEIRGVVETSPSKQEIRGVVETSLSKQEIPGVVETSPSKQEIRGVVETSPSKREIRGVVAKKAA